MELIEWVELNYGVEEPRLTTYKWELGDSGRCGGIISVSWTSLSDNYMLIGLEKLEPDLNEV